MSETTDEPTCSGCQMREQELTDLRQRVAAIPQMQQCSTCCGTPHPSGLPCICDGKNTRDAEVTGLRLQAIDSGNQLAAARERIRQLEAMLVAVRRAARAW